MNRCAPHIQKAGGSSCFTTQQLKNIANACNNDPVCILKGNGKKINSSLSKEKLWIAIRNKLAKQCKYEWCWLDQKFIHRIKNKEILNSIIDTFRPPGPESNKSWLTTTQINKVMEQYEKKYIDFKFYGPFPIDFAKIYNEFINQMKLKQLYNQGIRKLGFVFNLDPSDMPGSHWVALYVDMRPTKRVIGFYDSRGTCPPPRQIGRFISILSSQAKDIYPNGNEFDIKCNRYRHQHQNSECGVYSMYFLLKSLKGKSFEQIENEIILDDEMYEYRKLFFRPSN